MTLKRNNTDGQNTIKSSSQTFEGADSLACPLEMTFHYEIDRRNADDPPPIGCVRQCSSNLFRYAGRRFPDGLYEYIDGNLPLPDCRRFYSVQPIHERRDPIINYADAPDIGRRLVNRRGSLRHQHDRTDDRTLAAHHNIPLSGIVLPAPNPYDAQDRIDELTTQLTTERQLRCTAEATAVRATTDLQAARNSVTTQRDLVNSYKQQVTLLQQHIATLENPKGTPRSTCRRTNNRANNDDTSPVHELFPPTAPTTIRPLHLYNSLLVNPDFE